MFEKASRKKLRFNTVKGDVTVEDLWDLPLTSRDSFNLDTVAKELNKAVKDSGEESFVVKKTGANVALELKFDIVKYIIKVRLEEVAAKTQTAENKVKREKLLTIIADIEDTALKGESIEDLKKMAEELK